MASQFLDFVYRLRAAHSDWLDDIITYLSAQWVRKPGALCRRSINGFLLASAGVFVNFLESQFLQFFDRSKAVLGGWLSNNIFYLFAQ